LKLNIPVKFRSEWRENNNGEIGPNVMLVAHGGVINIIYYIINGLKWSNKCATLCELSSTGIHTVEYISGSWKITDSNNIEHLQ
jgi:broad specificity phosphatase PhoE